MIQELMTLVDENDNIIGYKQRGTLEHGKDIYRISALRLENSKGEVLIAQRSYSKKNQGGKRGPAVSGTVNHKENYQQNIVKESQEEIGLELKEYKIGPKEFVHAKQNNNRKYFRQRFIATTDKKIEEFKLQKEEVESIQRISKEKLLKRVENSPQDFTANAKHYINLFCK